MRDEDNTKEQLVNEIGQLRQQLSELERLESECKQSETMLQKERDKAQNYLDVAGVIIVVIDPDQKVSLINRKGCEVLGYKEKDIIGKNWFDIFLPQRYGQEISSVFKKLMAGEIAPVEYFENPVLTIDGDERLIAWHNNVLKDEDGNIAGTLSSGEDITLRREAEEAVKRCSDIIENMEIGLHVYHLEDLNDDRTLRMVASNPAASIITGIPNEDVLEKTLDENFPGLRKLNIPQTYAEVVRTGMSKTLKDVFYGDRRVQEGVFSVKAFPLPNNFVGVAFEDITERKSSEAALKASEEKYSTVVEKGNDGILIIQDGILKFANEMSTRMLGYTKEELIGRSPFENISEEYRDLVIERYERRVKNDPLLPKKYEVAIISKDGRTIPVELSASYIEYEDRPADMLFLRDITDRKRTEEELKASEEKYSTLVEKSNDGIVIIQDYVLKFANLNFAETTGYAREEVIEKPLADFISQEYRDLVIERYEKRIKNDLTIPRIYEIGILSKDGRDIPAEINSSFIEYEGRPATMTIFRDITDRKQAEAALKASEEKYSNLVEKSNDGIVIIQDYVLKFANSKFAETMGYTKEKIIGRPLAEFVSEKHRNLVVERYEKRIRKDATIPSKYEVYFRSRYGKPIPIEVNASYIEYEGRPADMAIFRDITERKKAEMALKASEEKYSTLVEKGNDGIVIIQDYLLKFANEKFAESVGYARDEVIDKPLAEFISAEHRHLVVGRYEKRIKKDTTIPRIYEVNFQSKNGKQVPMEINASYIEYEGKPADMAIFRDITERKASEDALKKQAFELSNAYEDLKSLDKMKDEFLSNVGHELKTPLISIMGYGELMVDGKLGELTDQQKKAMDAIVRNSSRLRRLIDSLLYLSIIKAGKVKYRFERVQIAEIIDNMVSDMYSQVEKNGLRINKDVSDDLPFINADRDYLPQVLFNLIDNAIKFTPSGGLITVASFEEDEYLHIAVSDTGIGIPKDMIPDIFKLFYQIDASTTRRYDGTGLGMYVCKQIIESHDGEIWIESEEGVGTTVHLLLPK